MITIEDLCDEYWAWCIHQRLPLVDANKQLCGLVTEAQRQWLQDFCKRWDRQRRAKLLQKMGWNSVRRSKAAF